MRGFFRYKKVTRRLITLVFLMGIYGYIAVKKQTVDIKNINTLELISAKDILWYFQINEGEKFLGQILSIEGVVTQKSDSTLVLNNSVHCFMDTSLENKWFDKNEIIISGRCLGYYEPMKKVQLDHCIVNTN